MKVFKWVLEAERKLKNKQNFTVLNIPEKKRKEGGTLVIKDL
jgi:hypothetical protein